jgi:hypothetical protein
MIEVNESNSKPNTAIPLYYSNKDLSTDFSLIIIITTTKQTAIACVLLHYVPLMKWSISVELSTVKLKLVTVNWTEHKLMVGTD